MNRLELYIDGAARGQGNVTYLFCFDCSVVIEHVGELECPRCGEAMILSRHTGEAAAAVVIYQKAKKIGSFARGLGKRTNNEAEYEALITAMSICWGVEELKDPIVYCDSAVVVNQVNGLWRCNNEALQPLLLTVRELQEVVGVNLVLVNRKKVWEADALTQLFLDELTLHRKGVHE